MPICPRLATLGCTVLMLCAVATAATDAPRARLLDVRRIWDKARHNAFTDLTRHQGKWYCAFREGQSHVCDTGKLRIIASADGQTWEPVAQMAWDGGDVRDARLTVTAEGHLMLNGAVRLLKPVRGQTHQSVVWLSSNGTTWRGPHRIGDPNVWMWSAAWHKGVGYSVGYSTAAKRFIRLYQTRNGEAWTRVADDLFPGGTYANETSLVFLPDDTCYCLLRRDSHGGTAQLGKAAPPYGQWAWSDLGVRIGGPKMIRLPDGRFLATVRLYDKRVRTGLCHVDIQNSRLEEILTLPSGGDTSYAGMVFHQGVLWISYYSSHEKKTCIYLARVELSPAGGTPQ